eukprot:TRINITY_DN21899_c0_g1_i1.p1 TRINITY_DN21899_c0_g1~~TRINITY_DN21899_c0_g1_i1.p1  ORF type:complete len:141 (+),score=29.17 TRINITY_DN21899_c0_g1_i1:89-511(+)
MSVTTCTISEDVKARFKKFQLVGKDSKNAAFIMKINTKTQEVEVDDVIEADIGDVSADLPESVPRYIVYNYKWIHADGRVSYPLMFIFYCPPGISTNLNMLYSSTKTLLSNELKLTKIFDVRDAEELDDKWLQGKLAFFK